MPKFTQKLQETEWNIAVVENSLESIVKGEPLKYRMMRYQNKDSWYADPFVLDVNDSEITLLAEEMLYSLGHARISKLVIDRGTLNLKRIIPLLTLPTHLSYPAIIREGKRIFVYPESGYSGKLTRYLYDVEKETLTELDLIMEGSLADATIYPFEGSDFLFCTKLPDCNGKELHIYKKIDNEWKLFQIYKFNENIARMGGDFFRINDEVYRPAQDCNASYGNGLVIQKVELKDGQFHFTEVSRYFSDNKIYPDGIHTLNSLKNVTVVDFCGKPRYPLGKAIITLIKKIIYRND